MIPAFQRPCAIRFSSVFSVAKWLSTQGLVFHLIEPDKYLGDCGIQGGRDVVVQIHLHQQVHQFFRFMHKNPVFPGTRDDLLGNQAVASGDDARCQIASLIGEGDGLLIRDAMAAGHVLVPIDGPGAGRPLAGVLPA